MLRCMPIAIADNAALVLVDVQNGFIGESTKHIPSLIGSFIRQRSKDFACIVATRFLNYPNSPYIRLIGWSDLMKPPRTDLIDEVRDVPDIVLDKHTYCNAEDIAVQLRKRGVTIVYLAGVDTDVCVLQNAAGLFDRGFEVYVLYDLCATNAGSAVHNAMLTPLCRTIGGRQVIRGTI